MMFLLNQLPTKTICASCPYFTLFGTSPMYEHLHVFGCACYPNMSATAPHMLAPRSALCVFLGYFDHHKGYRCLDLSTNRLVISRHVVFDEAIFPFAASPHPTDSLDFLLMEEAPVVPPIGTPLLTGSTVPHTATLELVPSSLDSTPPGVVSTAPRRVPMVPPGFLPLAAPAIPVAPRAAPTTPVAPRVILMSPTVPCTAPTPPASPSPPPRVWPISPITYVHRPCRPAAPAAPALLTSTPTHQPVTAVTMTPLVNLHSMVTHSRVWF
jgi:hypothetical protein